MRVGIIGIGRHGSRYANHIVKDVDGLELEAVCRRSADGGDQAGQWRCRWHREWRALVADSRVEAVVAVVPPALNPDIARLCAEHGKPLLLEKPLAVSSAEAGGILALCRTNNLRLTVGQTLRYNPVVRKLRRKLTLIGTLCGFSANQRLEPSSLAWHNDPAVAGAGVSFHTAVHVFDALRFITGLEVKRLMAVFKQWHNPQLEDQLAVLVEMDRNVIGTIDCAKVGHSRSGRYEFVGYKGQLQGDQVHNVVELVNGTEIKTLYAGAPGMTILPLLQDWQRFLAGQGANPIPGEEGFAAVRLCEACQESSRSGNWVDV